MKRFYDYLRAYFRKPFVRPWALSAPILVLLICLPLLRPLRHPASISDDELLRLETISALARHRTLAIDPGILSHIEPDQVMYTVPPRSTTQGPSATAARLWSQPYSAVTSFAGALVRRYGSAGSIRAIQISASPIRLPTM